MTIIFNFSLLPAQHLRNPPPLPINSFALPCRNRAVPWWWWWWWERGWERGGVVGAVTSPPRRQPANKINKMKEKKDKRPFPAHSTHERERERERKRSRNDHSVTQDLKRWRCLSRQSPVRFPWDSSVRIPGGGWGVETRLMPESAEIPFQHFKYSNRI